MPDRFPSSILVVGATGGVGRAATRAFADRGWHLILAGRDDERLGEVLSGHCNQPALLVGTGADGSLDFTPVAPHLEQTGRRLDVVVFCAGQWSHGQVLDSTTDHYRDLFETNVEVPRNALAALGPIMTESASTVIAVSSTQASATSSESGAYSASMHAARAMFEAFRLETRPHGVRLMRIELGRTATPMAEQVSRARNEAHAPETLIQPDDVADVVLSLAALPRSATVTELTLLPA